MEKDLYILGIESSCDETAASIVKNGTEIVSNVVASQIESHKRFGGVVPEIASRHHVENVTMVIEEALKQANMEPADLDAVCVTEGPGLVGALLIGINAAKAFAFAHNLPLVGTHHIAGHIYANNLMQPMEFPLLALVVSGGHTELVLMDEHGSFELIGETRDDAAGEAYDKVARVLDIPYPGPRIDKMAHESDEAIEFPRVWLEKDSYDFSFSGLKSAVINYQHNAKQRGGDINPYHIAKGFQDSVVEVLSTKTLRAAREFGVKQVIAAEEGIPFFVPPLKLCTDNAAMIAAAGTEMFKAGKRSGWDLNGRPGMELLSWND